MSTVTYGSGGGLLRLVVIVLIVAAALVTGGFAFLHSVTQPVPSRGTQDPAELLLNAEEVELHSTDGVRLAAWFIRGRRGAPPIVLCHDLGGSRSDLLNAAVVLNKAGHPLILFDFRRHGGSGVERSTLGVHERLDVLAAVQYLKNRKNLDAASIGGWGVGMGAYALALAALETPELKALALDSLYPEVPAEASRLLRRDLPPALGLLVPVMSVLYNPYFRCRLGEFAVKDRLIGLAGRHLLLIAASESPERFEQERLLYEAVPEGPEGGKNLLELRRSGLSGLYAEDRTKYDETIRGFFSTYLSPGGSVAGRTVEVIEP